MRLEIVDEEEDRLASRHSVEPTERDCVDLRRSAEGIAGERRRDGPHEVHHVRQRPEQHAGGVVVVIEALRDPEVAVEVREVGHEPARRVALAAENRCQRGAFL